MKKLWIDIETYSSVSLQDCGVYKYSASPDFEILLFGYAYDEEPVRVIELALGETLGPQLESDLFDPSVQKYAHNAAFERVCLSRYFNRTMDPAQWTCTATMARELGLPGSLEGAGDALGFTEDKKKLKTGKALIRYFSVPCKPTASNGGRTRNLPEHDLDRWDLYVEYNRQDVVTEREIGHILEKYEIADSEWKLYQLDQKINDRGVRADITLARQAIAMDEDTKEELTAKMQDLTGISNPNSNVQLKDWIEAKTGQTVESLEKKVIEDVKKQLNDSSVTEVLEIRAMLSKTSTKKYTAILNTANSDDRIRGLTMFYGASRTGRWAGRLVQMQNLPQNHLNDEELDTARELVKNGDRLGVELLYENVTDTLSQLIRTAFIPAIGNKFIVSDFSAIEARVLAWLAGEKWRMEVFKNGGDIYCASASQMFHKPVVKHGINGELRVKGKIAELALGYGGAVGALKAMDYTHSLNESEMLPLVQAWRKASPEIVKFWWEVDTCAQQTINTGQSTRSRHGIRFRKNGPMLRVRLPSGRELSYVQPKITADGITYMGTDQKTGQWSRIETYGPKLVENIVQATARDCLAESMFRLEKAGASIVFHVHDEVICDVKADAFTGKEIEEIMSQPIDWAPGLILNAEAYECQYYKKD